MSPNPWESEEDRAWLVSRLSEYNVYLLGEGVIAGFIRDAFKRLSCEDKLVSLSVDGVGVYHGDNSILLVDGQWLARNLDKVDVGKLMDTARYIEIVYLYPNVSRRLAEVLRGKVSEHVLEELQEFTREYRSYWKDAVIQCRLALSSRANETHWEREALPYSIHTCIWLFNFGDHVEVMGPTIGCFLIKMRAVKRSVEDDVISFICAVVKGGYAE